jgi:hypothetical protein
VRNRQRLTRLNIEAAEDQNAFVAQHGSHCLEQAADRDAVQVLDLAHVDHEPVRLSFVDELQDLREHVVAVFRVDLHLAEPDNAGVANHLRSKQSGLIHESDLFVRKETRQRGRDVRRQRRDGVSDRRPLARGGFRDENACLEGQPNGSAADQNRERLILKLWSQECSTGQGNHCRSRFVSCQQEVFELHLAACFEHRGKQFDHDAVKLVATD